MPRTILVVDDVTANRLILKAMLKKDYDMLEAVSGEEALDVLRSKHDIISAVLLDIGMPGMDGYEVLRRIRSDKKLSSMPVIMITSSSDEASRIKSLSIGANDYVMKPYSSEIIKHCLKNNISFHEAAATVSALQRDKLTGLYTREAFFEKVRLMVAEREPGFYVMSCIDIDNFKVINDKFGVEMGDRILVCLANNIERDCDADGSICGRIAADNFAVLYEARLPEERFASRNEHMAGIVAGAPQPFTVSIGRYNIADKTLPVSAMYDRAVIARKTVKGRSDVHIAMYDESMRSRIIREQEIVSEMRAALEDRQFEVWFQPQYNHATNAMIGSEALVRWRSPRKGIIPPNEFIPIFEQNGFIYDMDKYVWEEVCRYLRKWIDEGRSPLPVSVNISRYDILRSDLIETLTGLVSSHGIPRELLRLEVTESAFAQSARLIVNVVKELIDLGFTVEIDDFGSGYSSLNTLKDVPAQIIKLDMKFLESSEHSQRGGSIVESVVRMAKWLGVSVIAEGVEAVEQADYLRSIGCYYMQGYLYARPMTAAQYEAHCKGAGKEERLLTIETVENLDNNAFWDPKSMDTIIFNSYVGAACIFEYSCGKIEVVRSTKRFAEMIGGAALSVEDTLKLDWNAYLDVEGRKTLENAIRQSKKTNADVTSEIQFISLPGCPEKTYIRATLRVIATTGERCLVYNLVENITERRKAQREAQEAARQIQTLMDDAPGGFALMRLMPEGNFATLYVNDGLCRMRKMTREQLMAAEGDDALANTHPDDVPQVLSTVQNAMIAGDTCRLQYRLRGGDCEYAWFSVFARMTRGDDGETLIHIYYAELTEGEKRDLTLRETMPFVLSAIMGSSENLDFAKDKDFNYICCSPAFVKFTRQKSEADVIGKNDYDIWTKEEADHFRRDDVQLFESGESLINYTEPIPSDDGIQHYSVTSKYILRDSAGEIIGLYGSGRDITDTRAALDRLQLLTDSIPGGLATYAISPGLMKITYFNDGFCKMLGCTREEYEALTSQNGIVSKIFPEDLPRLMAQLDELMAHDTPIDCTYRCNKLDGSGYIWINLRGVFVERFADTAFVNTVLYDVTAQREAEQKEKKTAQRLQTIMDNAGTGIRAMILSGGKLEYLFANNKFYELQGYTKAQYEAEVSDAYNVIHPDDMPGAKAAIQSAVHEGDSAKLEFRVVTRAGETRWLRAVITVTRFDGVTSPVQLCVYTDITETVEAQGKKEEAQRRLLDNMPYGAALYEYDGVELTAVHLNRKYWELVEREMDACGRLSISDAVHPDDRELMLNELKAAIREKRNASVNLRIRCKETNYKPFSVNANITEKSPGEYLIYAAYEPVDPDALSYQQALPLLLSAVMNATNDFAFAKDKDCRYICASPAFLRLAKLDNEREVIGKTDFDLFPADMAEQFRQNDLAIISSGKPLVDYEETIHAPDGMTHYCRASKYPLHDAFGHIVGLYGVSRDITRERGALEQLRLVNDSVPGGIATYSVKDCDIRISYCNDGFCRLFGGTRESLIKRGEIDPIEWVHKDDVAMLLEQVNALVERNTPIDCVYRVKNANGSYKWISQKAVATQRRGDTVFFNAMLLDVNERQLINEQLRISEEESNLAVAHSGSLVCRYDVLEKTLTTARFAAEKRNIPEVLKDVPYEPVRLGMISRETADAYIGFFEAISKGNKTGTVLFQQRYLGQWQWEEAKSSTVFADDGAPVKAVISMTNVTERIEKENIYKKWQQSLADRAPASYTLFRTNISHRSDYDAREGSLLSFDFNSAGSDAQEVARAYASQCIYEEDRDKYIAFVNADTMLASYYRGRRSDMIEYRELIANGNVRWLRLTIDLVEYPNTTDIEAYMMYEDIDEAKKEELQTKALSENDPLTGVLNRTTFVAKVNRILQRSEPDVRHALLMLDIDGFKQVNDVFGHGAGDRTLVDLADGIKSMMRHCDLAARLGGDEFVVFLGCVSNTNAVIAKAKQIRSLARKSLSMEVQISVSVGIALSPSDGADFETLYKKADSALYYVKGSGKDNQAVYSESMADEHLKPEPDTFDAAGLKMEEKRRRMLIVDDSDIDYMMLKNIFREEFITERAKDGQSALIRLRHYGSAISVVLLDLMMPGMNGYAVLGKMQESAELRSIPVIIVSGDESRETCLETIRKGATDFITKPVDIDLIRIRVHSAISKAENERLRTKNSLLEVQNQEQRRYEAFLESPGIAFIEYDCLRGKFSYYPSISNWLLGAYDDRDLWQILLSDAVADAETVRDMQNLVRNAAQSGNETVQTGVFKLQTPKNATHIFRVTVRKTENEYPLASRLVITIADINCEV